MSSGTPGACAGCLFWFQILCVADRPAARISPVHEFVRPGDRVFVRCEGGPCLSRLEYVPPWLVIEERGGTTYVLVDKGGLPEWRSLFVPDRPDRSQC